MEHPTIAELSQAIEQEAEKCPAAQRLTTHPGVGALTALAFVLIIGNAERFHCGKQVTSYLAQGGILCLLCWYSCYLPACRSVPRESTLWPRSLAEPLLYKRWDSRGASVGPGTLAGIARCAESCGDTNEGLEVSSQVGEAKSRANRHTHSGNIHRMRCAHKRKFRLIPRKQPAPKV